jgi:5-methylcytosine-specific restriction endonuclease McrA
VTLERNKNWQQRKWRLGALHRLGFGRDGYDKYLESPYWKEFRRKKFAEQLERIGHNCCEQCATIVEKPTVELQVHHLTYERLGNELMGDVQIICRECHKKVHSRDVESQKRHRAQS